MLNIQTIDSLYIKPLLASVYLLTKNGHACLVDAGTNDSVIHVINALKESNIDLTNVDYIFLTHIHLDHAGGASQMMEVFPNAQLVVHPYGSKHMIDPSKLIAGVKHVYGDKYDELYGEIKPIDQSRVIETTDGMVINFQNEELLIIDTPGHANHHNCILHKASDSCFTGDTFGLCYPSINGETDTKQKVLLPTTTPSQFSPEKLIASINKVMAHQPKFLYPTHYGKYEIHGMSIIQLIEHIMNYCLIAEQFADESHVDKTKNTLYETILNYMTLQIEPTTVEAKEWLAMDAELNAQGLEVWLKKKALNKIS